MILHLLLRLVAILAGYGLASAASGAAVGVTFFLSAGGAGEGFLSLIAIAIIFVAVYAALPALVTVAVGEAAALRHPGFYIFAATVIGVGLPIIVGLGLLFVGVGLLFGPVAGLIYWIVSGRRAGWRRPTSIAA